LKFFLQPVCSITPMSPFMRSVGASMNQIAFIDGDNACMKYFVILISSLYSLFQLEIIKPKTPIGTCFLKIFTLNSIWPICLNFQ
jgi:hypothetical protein